MWYVLSGLFCLVLLGILSYRHDVMLWNDGVCPDSGREWRRFEERSSSPRGYECKACGKVIWISFPVDKALNEVNTSVREALPDEGYEEQEIDSCRPPATETRL